MQSKKPEEASTQLSQFVPDAGGAPTTNATTMLVAAYGVFWLLLFAFIAATWRKQSALSNRLARIEKALDGKS